MASAQSVGPAAVACLRIPHCLQPPRASPSQHLTDPAVRLAVGQACRVPRPSPPRGCDGLVRRRYPCVLPQLPSPRGPGNLPGSSLIVDPVSCPVPSCTSAGGGFVLPVAVLRLPDHVPWHSFRSHSILAYAPCVVGPCDKLQEMRAQPDPGGCLAPWCPRWNPINAFAAFVSPL